jgi:arsenite methyltransferase
MVEFNETRARLYHEALTKYPIARLEDIEVMKTYLNPMPNDKILGIGEGDGYFYKHIANAIGIKGEHLATDPSYEQLKNLDAKIQIAGAEEIDVPENYFDKVWTFGAFHHCPNQTEAMRRMYRTLKPGGKLVICDVFSGSTLAKHFDSQVAKYCATGHEVKFLSESFAQSLCQLTGFKGEIYDLPLQWHFDTLNDMGEFIYKLHAMTKLSGNYKEKLKHIVRECKNILGIEETQKGLALNWPMKVLVATK